MATTRGDDGGANSRARETRGQDGRAGDYRPMPTVYLTYGTCLSEALFGRCPAPPSRPPSLEAHSGMSGRTSRDVVVTVFRIRYPTDL